MNLIYQNILSSIANGEKLLAVLIDPDKMILDAIPGFISKLNNSVATHIFVGGSIVGDCATEDLVAEIKRYTEIPVVLFPGDTNQITDKADALLFLSLISGRNADYLIGKHVSSISRLRKSNLEVISTGYLLINGGKETAVERVTGTKPLSVNDIQHIVDTAKAGELLGMKMLYLEAGSGAEKTVASDVIRRVKTELNIPLIVGGGIRTREGIEMVYDSGADLAVIGTALEENASFFNNLRK